MGTRVSRSLVLAGLALVTTVPAGPVGRWEFDGTLTDASGNGRAGVASNAQFTAVEGGQALAPGTRVEVPHAEPLQLYPQLDIRCRFRLSATAERTQDLVRKDREYLLRVDWAKENGSLSFFVFVDGQWEPRMRGLVPKIGQWYDVRARWDGRKLMLDVNGQRWSCPRPGAVAATENPVQFGPIAGLIDRIEIRNPGYACEQALLRVDRESSGDRPAPPRFGGGDGWRGWRGVGGAACEDRDGVLQARFPQTGAMIVGPALRADAATLPFVCMDIAAPESMGACLHFLGDGGVGAIPFHPLRDGRSTMLEVASHPAWRGRIRRLALSVVAEEPVALGVSRLAASDRQEGKPFLTIRSFAPEHAKLRPGRPEKLIAAVKNLGGFAANVRATLHLPDGVESADGIDRTLEALPASSFDLLTWTVRAEHPVSGSVALRVSAPGGRADEIELPVVFEVLPSLPRTGYVPVPQPAKTDYLGLMHYCALWKEGTHYGWGRIEPWPDRRPAIGYYDEGTPEVADWHIKYALEHGINAFIYCWYRADLKPVITHSLGHAIHEGLYEARYRDRFRFCIMWENGCAQGVKDADDLLANLLPFWIENYFRHPSYLRIDNQPVLVVWRPERVGPQLGGTEGARAAFGAMRAAMRNAGFGGIRLIGCLNQANAPLQQRLAAEGWDATSGYALVPQACRIVGTDVEGIPIMDHGQTLAASREEWEARRDAGPLPDIPNVMMGWDPRPWHGDSTSSYRADPKPQHFEAACRDAKDLIDAAPDDAWYRGLVVFDNWTEFGEGHYIEPTSGTGFGYVNAIKRVFCTDWAPEAVTDVIPEDVGLEPPQKRYMVSRMLYGGLPWRPRVIRDNLVGWWRFDGENDGLLLDSSPSAFHLARHSAPRVAGRSGKALECGEGWGNHPAHSAFCPPTGITVSLWCNPSVPEQSDRWMLNCVGNGSDGYRLGMAGGRAAWQVPRERWSHNMNSPEPLPVGSWTHVAATFDNRTMALYINGKQVGQLERPGLIRPSRGDLNIGTYGGTRARFQGLLDDIRLHDRPLTAAEIDKLAAE